MTVVWFKVPLCLSWSRTGRAGWWQLPKSPACRHSDQRLTSGEGRESCKMHWAGRSSGRLARSGFVTEGETGGGVLTLLCPRVLEVNSLSSHVGPRGWHIADRCWDRGGWQGTRAPQVNLFHRSHVTLSTFSVCCQTYWAPLSSSSGCLAFYHGSRIRVFANIQINFHLVLRQACSMLTSGANTHTENTNTE